MIFFSGGQLYHFQIISDIYISNFFFPLLNSLTRLSRGTLRKAEKVFVIHSDTISRGCLSDMILGIIC